MGLTQQKFTEKTVRANLPAGMHCDGQGLYLAVDESNAKRWILRLMVQGKRRDLGLGGYPAVGLGEAREMAAGHRKIAKSGGDPFAKRNKHRQAMANFVLAGIKGQDAPKASKHSDQTRLSALLAALAEIQRTQSENASALSLVDTAVGRQGDLSDAASTCIELGDQFEAMLLWTNEHALSAGRQYLMRLASQQVISTVTEIKYREDVKTGAHLAAKNLGLNQIAKVNLSTSAPVRFEPYQQNRLLGSFILTDKHSHETVGVGLIEFALRRANNIRWQALDLNRAVRAAQKQQTPQCIWFTGLSGSGKSTIANLLDKRLHAKGRHTYLLDGDNVRHGLSRDLGFTETDRIENIRRVSEVAKLMVEAGLIVLVSFISPFRSERQMARELFQPGEFIEVFVDAPLQACEQRDVKGLYAKARRGDLKNFTGIDSPYETPQTPEIHLLTSQTSADQCVEQILKAMI